MQEPMHWSSKIMRNAIREIEAANAIRFGNESWEIIRKALAEIDTKWEQILEEEISRKKETE